MKSLLTITTLLLILISCSEVDKSKEEIQSFEHQNIPVSEKIEKALSEEYLASIGLDKSALSFLSNYYKNRNFKPRWINNASLTQEGKD